MPRRRIGTTAGPGIGMFFLLCTLSGPNVQRHDPADGMKISVRCQQGELVANAKLSEKCVYGPGLYASSPAFDSQFCCIDMIIPIRDDQR
jgi:hypothetical protein